MDEQPDNLPAVALTERLRMLVTQHSTEPLPEQRFVAQLREANDRTAATQEVSERLLADVAAMPGQISTSVRDSVGGLLATSTANLQRPLEEVVRGVAELTSMPASLASVSARLDAMAQIRHELTVLTERVSQLDQLRIEVSRIGEQLAPLVALEQSLGEVRSRLDTLDALMARIAMEVGRDDEKLLTVFREELAVSRRDVAIELRNDVSSLLSHHEKRIRAYMDDALLALGEALLAGAAARSTSSPGPQNAWTGAGTTTGSHLVYEDDVPPQRDSTMTIDLQDGAQRAAWRPSR